MAYFDNDDVLVLRGGKATAGVSIRNFGNSSEILLTSDTGVAITGTLSTTGNVGIGLSNPQSKLTVTGTSPATSSPATYQGTIQINETALSTLQSVGGLEFRGAVFGSGYGSKITSTDTGDLLFGSRSNNVAWTQNMVLLSSGNLGIGVSNPSKLLDVNGDALINGLTVGRGTGAIASNTVVGYQAGYSNTTGNIEAVGYQALYANTSGLYNSAFGYAALTSNETGTRNVGFGRGALTTNISGASNTALGVVALNLNTGSYNTAVGDGALVSNTTSSNNTAVGYQAGYSNTTGNSIVAIGTQASYTNSTGLQITAVGFNALKLNTANYNSAFGSNSQRDTSTGTANTSVGISSMLVNSTGANNVAVGADALVSNTTASNSTAVGYQAGYTGNTARGTFVGHQAGYSATAAYNTHIGSKAGFNASGASNTFVGAVGTSTDQGCGELMTTGNRNSIFGAFNGNQGGLDIRTLNNYIVLSDGDGNPRGIFDGSGNFAVGGVPTIGTGGKFQVISDQDTSIFKCTSSTTYAAIVSSVENPAARLMAFQYGSGGSPTTVGNITTNGTITSYNVSSDYRLKENIVPMTGALATVAQLKPVTYKWKSNGSDGQGFIAHELAEVVSDCVTGEKDAVDENGKPIYQGIDTSHLVATLVSAIQELKAEFDAYKATHL
jgi:hypothetical protein